MSNERKEFSVVIPIFNSSSYIEETIQSIYNSSAGFEVEVILIDDLSDDLPSLQTIIAKYPFVNLILKKKKTNAADSRNIGIKASRYEKIFLLDSDDHYTQEYIQNRNNLMDNNESSVYFGGYTTIIDSKRFITARADYKNNDIRDYLFLEGGDFRTSTVTIDKKYYKGTLFDAEMKKHQDWGFGIRCYDAGERLYYDNSAMIFIHEGRVGQMSSTMNIEASDYFIKHYLSDKKHLIKFVEVHIIRALCNKDLQALTFFFKLLDGITLSKKKKLIHSLLRLGSKKGIIHVSSPALYSLRRLKKALQ